MPAKDLMATSYNVPFDLSQSFNNSGFSSATAARLMDLDTQTIQQALGIAEYHAPNLPMERDLIDPAMVKHGHGGAVMTGIIAAEVAERGFTGIPGLL